jgi:DMSO/TMAO reductase YedYZ molybdopterin-dependent catalytic subunit
LQAVVTFLLILTGLLLNSQSLRVELADLRIYLRYAHVLLGGVFAITITSYGFVFARNWQESAYQNKGKFAILVFFLLSVGVFLSGVLLFFRVEAVTVTGISTLNWHKILSAISVMAVSYHTLSMWLHSMYTPTRGESGEQTDRSFLASRRVFIRWAASVGALLSGGGIAQLLRGEKNTDLSLGKASLYKNCNKMEPQPVPSLGSVPPIGGGYKGEFDVFTVTTIPCANSDTWQFRLFGLVDRSLTLSWEDFLNIPRKVQISDFHCITGWSVHQVTYEGIPLSRFLDIGGVKPQARYVKFYSDDGVYTSALSLEQARMEDVMVAVLIDGEPIPSDLGGPARLIVPQMFAYKGVKWVNAIELIPESHIGYWESRGYENDAWVKKI